jgi:hypothetical protein
LLKTFSQFVERKDQKLCCAIHIQEEKMRRLLLAQVFLTAASIASLILTPVYAQTPPTTPEAQGDVTSSESHGAVPVVYKTNPRPRSGEITAAATEDILLIQTNDPWEDSSRYIGSNWYDGITADTEVLDSLGYSYRIATWADIGSGAVNIFAYPVVLIVNDQVQAFYDDYAAHVAEFEAYVSTGHTLVFFAAGGGWAEGQLYANLPGGVHWNYVDWDTTAAYYNVIVDASHPIVTGELSDRTPLQNADLYNNKTSHGYFSSLPAGTRTILRASDSEGGQPTLVEYQLGRGRVIASTLTWEHNWGHWGGSQYGYFAQKALDDVFLYAFSGGAVPADVKLDLRVEDAPAWIDVNKSRGSYVDVVARVTGDAAYQASVELQIPSDKLGTPVETFTRDRPDNTGAQSVLYTNPGSGRYQITTTLQSLAWQYYKEIVWRFRVPDGATPEQGIELTATVSVLGHTVQNPTSKVKFNIIDYALSLIVTNRKLLFGKYQPDPTQTDVSTLLEDVYAQAWSVDGEVFYVDLYGDNTVKDWSQAVDYSNENAANTVATAIDGFIEGWYNRLTKRLSSQETLRPEFLLIVGGDEVIPFYRANDGNYNSCWLPVSRVQCEEDIFPDGQTDPVLQSWDRNYFFSDNIYADVGGGKADWETGELELSTGRIIGNSAAAMRQFIENASLATPPLTQAVMASRSDNHNLDTVRERLNSKHVTIYGESNPDLTENDAWTREQWITALEQQYQMLAYQGHGAYDGWGGTDKWTTKVTASDQPVGHINENHPLLAVEACNFAIPTDLDGDTWRPEVNDNISYKLISLGAGGILGSMGIDTTAGGNNIAYGERLHNDYFKYLITPTSSSSLFFGTALLRAKQTYPPNGDKGSFDSIDKKTLLEYVYYGLPWSFVETPDNQAAQAIISQAANGYTISADTPQIIAQGSYSRIFTATITSYQFVPVTGFELLNIPGADNTYSLRKPILPILYTTFNLPPGAIVSGVDWVREHSTALGKHNVPAADPETSFNHTTGYTSTMDVSGVYPPAPRYAYQVNDLGDHLEVRIAIVPATFNVDTHDATLYDSTTLRVNYSTPVSAVISFLSVNKPQYRVGEVITPTATVENIGASPLTLVGRINVYDAVGTMVGTTSSNPFTVPGGSSYFLQLPWTPSLNPGGYRMTLSVEQADVPQTSASTSFNVLAGKITSFSAPQSITFDEYGTFSLSFANYRATSITALAKVHIYDSFGIEAVSLLQRTFIVDPAATGETSWSWNPAGLPEGTYTARAVVQVGGETYTSESRAMQVVGKQNVFLPLVVKGYTPEGGFNSQFNGSAPGWETHSGTWWIASDSWYTTDGLANAVASASYAASYKSFDYQAALWRFGCEGCANRLIIRGVPTPLGSSGDWYKGYYFQYTRNGYYSIWKIVAGTPTALQTWTSSSAVNQGNAWNTLRVVANGTKLYYYINGMLVWSGSDSSLALGRVGIGMYRDSTSTGDQLYVDWAKLSSLGAAGLGTFNASDKVSPEQQALNDEANQRGGGSVNMAPKRP